MSGKASLDGRKWLEKYRLDLPNNVSNRSTHVSSPAAQPPVHGFFYIPDFITQDEETCLLQKISETPQPKWKVLQKRRLQNWGGQLSRDTLIPEPFPDFLARYPPIVDRITSLGVFDASRHNGPNHCLLNEYLPGQGIHPHEDGDAYYPVVATVSIGSHTLLDIYQWAAEEQGSCDADVAASAPANHIQARKEHLRAREQHPSLSILQEPRSLLITAGSTYQNFLHGIAERSRDEALHLSRVINLDKISDDKLRSRAAELSSSAKSCPAGREALVREKRISLTFRDVQKVSKGFGRIFTAGR